ncbi:hypothetical protein SGPA1_12162 [Streptomyces misionensis JCM 4497]
MTHVARLAEVPDPGLRQGPQAQPGLGHRQLRPAGAAAVGHGAGHGHRLALPDRAARAGAGGEGEPLAGGVHRGQVRGRHHGDEQRLLPHPAPAVGP